MICPIILAADKVYKFVSPSYVWNASYKIRKLRCLFYFVYKLLYRNFTTQECHPVTIFYQHMLLQRTSATQLNSTLLWHTRSWTAEQLNSWIAKYSSID